MHRLQLVVQPTATHNANAYFIPLTNNIIADSTADCKHLTQ